MKTRNLPFILSAIPLGVAVVSTLFFLIQGGFGAGHGRFDLIVALNVVPLMPFESQIAYLPRFIEAHDILLVVWFPALLNASVLFLLGLLIRGFVMRFSREAKLL